MEAACSFGEGIVLRAIRKMTERGFEGVEWAGVRMGSIRNLRGGADRGPSMLLAVLACC